MSKRKDGAILVVDDEHFVRDIVSHWLAADGYSCETVASGAEALDAVRRREFVLVVSDIMMPDMSGLELLKQVRERCPQTAVIMLTGVDERDTAIKALELGAYGYMIKPFEENEVLINVANALRRRELEILRDDFERSLQEQVCERTAEVRQTQEEITLCLTAASEYRDEDTGTHNRRMGLYAAVLAKQVGSAELSADDVRMAAPMHDIGKIGIPDGILLKPGKLTDAEFDIIKTHTTIGARMLGESGIRLLVLARDIALSHHEKWDGSGYPRGLSGEDIPLSARIVAIADVYDALINDRVYRPAMPEDKALAIMRGGRGTHFDPTVFDAFIKSLPEFRRIRRELANK